MWESDIGAFPVSWASQGDEWVFHLSKALVGHEHIRLEGHYGEKVVILGPADETLPSTLRLRPDPAGIRCTVVGDGDDASEDQVRRWCEAAASAAGELGSHNQDYQWQAVLGPNPRRPDVPVPPLAGPARFGPVLLTPGGIQMREWVGSGPAEIRQRRAGYSWPVIASGIVPTYDGTTADLLAKFVVQWTCALLTLLWRQHWLPRIGPQVIAPGSGAPPLRVPQSVGRWDHVEPDSSLPPDFNTYAGTESPLEIPAWAQGAWDVLDSDSTLRTAVGAHYEARGIDFDHPSAAFLGYVAAIEGVGSKLADLTECEICGSHTGARRRFRKALKTALTSKEARELEFAYDLRSATGHDGTLFGTETTLGYGRISAFEYDLRDMFGFTILGEIRNASRLVVTRALMSALGVDVPIE